MVTIPEDKDEKPWPVGRLVPLWWELGTYDAGPEFLYGDDDDEGGQALHFDGTSEYDEYIEDDDDD